MTNKEMLEMVYRLYNLPPKTERDAKRDFVWNLLQAGCDPYYILQASENMIESDCLDESYSEDEFLSADAESLKEYMHRRVWCVSEPKLHSPYIRTGKISKITLLYKRSKGDTWMLYVEYDVSEDMPEAWKYSGYFDVGSIGKSLFFSEQEAKDALSDFLGIS